MIISARVVTENRNRSLSRSQTREVYTNSRGRASRESGTQKLDQKQAESSRVIHTLARLKKALDCLK